MDVAGAVRACTPDSSAVCSHMDKILLASGRGRELIRNLLDFSRLDVSDSTIVDVNELLDEQLRLIGCSIDPSIRVQRELDASLRPVTGDVFALSGAFMHLLMNALDAMPDGGLLTLRTRMQGSDHVQIDFEDTGLGMAKDVLEKATEPFFSTKPPGKGAGLGLPSVYGAVKAHRGSMEIRSEPGRGTQVQIVLPVLRQDAPPQPLHGDKDADAHGLRILLVDDDNLVQRAVCAQLTRLGHTVAVANHGRAALDKLQDGIEVDLVLLDLDMPVLSGQDTLPLLRALRPSLPVIIETGSMGEIAEGLATSFADVAVLTRPFSLGELKVILDPWVARVRAIRP
jgi:CheY-like chemotaxis protein